MAIGSNTSNGNPLCLTQPSSWHCSELTTFPSGSTIKVIIGEPVNLPLDSVWPAVPPYYHVQISGRFFGTREGYIAGSAVVFAQPNSNSTPIKKSCPVPRKSSGLAAILLHPRTHTPPVVAQKAQPAVLDLTHLDDPNAVTHQCSQFIDEGGHIGPLGKEVVLATHRIANDCFYKSHMFDDVCPNFKNFTTQRKEEAQAYFWSSLAYQESSCVEKKNGEKTPIPFLTHKVKNRRGKMVEEQVMGTPVGLFQLENLKSWRDGNNRDPVLCNPGKDYAALYSPYFQITCTASIFRDLYCERVPPEGIVSAKGYFHQLMGEVSVRIGKRRVIDNRTKVADRMAEFSGVLLMKPIFLIFIITLNITAHAQEPVSKPKVENAAFTTWKEKVFQDTGLIPGYYKLSKGPKTCQFGELQLKDVGATASLMFSDHAVMIQLPWKSDPPPKAAEDEDGCTRSYHYQYSKGLIHGVQTVVCNASTGKDGIQDEHYDLDLKIVGKNLTFSIQDHDDPKQKGTVCRLTLSPDSP